MRARSSRAQSSRARSSRALVGGVAAALGLTLAGCTTVNPHYDPTRAHHRPDGFQNIDPAAHMPRPFAEFLRWQRERARLTIAPPVVDLSVVAPPLAAIHANRDALAVTWIGHATALVQIAGVNVLTDPVFSERASPVQWAGPRRWQPPGLRADQLPHIDVVLVSHNHYDHLDAASIAALAAQPGGPPLFVVPLGLERWFTAAGVQSVRWLDWWQSLQVDGLTITLTPAQHWSRRSYGDTMTTLWGGFVVESAPRHGRPGLRVFFAGDTGYSAQHFRAIGARFAPIDLALIPIGAYEPRWFMRMQHVDPAEAVQVHRDVGSCASLGIHWGTFPMTDEPLDAPLRDLDAARRAMGVGAEEFRTLRHGQRWVVR